MNNIEKDNWPHRTNKRKSMLGRVYLYVEEMINRKYPQPRKGQLEKHIEVAREKRLSERYIRGSLKQTQTALLVCWRSLNNIVRKIGIPKCDHNCHKCSFLCSLRRVITNGK